MWCFICPRYLEDDNKKRDEQGSHEQWDDLESISKNGWNSAGVVPR